MTLAAIVLVVFALALGGAILSARRWNMTIGVISGLAVALAGWAIASMGIMIWFSKSY